MKPGLGGGLGGGGGQNGGARCPVGCAKTLTTLTPLLQPAPPDVDARTADEWAAITRDDVDAVVQAVTARLAPRAAALTPLAVTGRYGSLDANADTDTDEDGWALAPPPRGPVDQHVAFKETLTTLLMDPGVREACAAALARDPNFRMIADAAAGGAVMELDDLLPPAARAAAAASGDGRDPLADIANAIAAAFDAISHRLARHGRAAAELMADLGRAIARVADGPLRAAGVPRAARAARRAADRMVHDVDWGNLMTVVAMATMAVLVVVRGPPPPPPPRRV